MMAHQQRDRHQLITMMYAISGCFCILLAATACGQSEISQQAGPFQIFDMKDLSIPVDEIHSGGPPKDGIPSLTDPEMASLEQVNYSDPDRMVVVQIGDDTRVYPINILNWHEAVNDEIAGIPIAVVYCPLCDSVTVVDRRMDDETLEFGISGLLYQSNVLLYDRQHDSLWSQVGLTAVSGPYVGQSLEHLPWQITSFAQVKQQHPDALIMTTNTGHQRNYARNPYAQYFTTDQLMFPVKRNDDRLDRKARVVGIKIDNQTRAYPITAIAEADGQTLEDELGGKSVTLQADDHGTVSVIDAPAQAMVVHTFWFTWAAFHPETDIYESAATSP